MGSHPSTGMTFWPRRQLQNLQRFPGISIKVVHSLWTTWHGIRGQLQFLLQHLACFSWGEKCLPLKKSMGFFQKNSKKDKVICMYIYIYRITCISNTYLVILYTKIYKTILAQNSNSKCQPESFGSVQPFNPTVRKPWGRRSRGSSCNPIFWSWDQWLSCPPNANVKSSPQKGDDQRSNKSLEFPKCFESYEKFLVPMVGVWLYDFLCPQMDCISYALSLFKFASFKCTCAAW